jgi:hypothetical protein
MNDKACASIRESAKSSLNIPQLCRIPGMGQIVAANRVFFRILFTLLLQYKNIYSLKRLIL